MNLVIQIPCLNEERTLPETLADIPRQLDGIDQIQVLIIDDGSTDTTSEVARAHGADRVVRFTKRRGLARAFARGIQEALSMGADIIVNTDADHQYRGQDIGSLIKPILEKRADMVVGARDIENIEEFSPLKKRLQRLGSSVVRSLSHTDVLDTTSGFRAYSREAAMRLTVVSDFTYTLETLIQAGSKNISVEHVPIGTNAPTRRSRLFGSMRGYIQRSVGTMFRIYVMYQPLRFFLALSTIFFIPSAVLFARFLYYYVTTPGPTGHIQSLLIAGVFGILGFLIATLGVVADLIAMNRRILEEMLTDVRVLCLGRTEERDSSSLD